MSAMKDSVRFMRRAYSHFRQYGMGGVRRYLRGKGVNLPSCSGLFHLVSPRRVSFPEWALPPANRPTHQIVVGVIADEFFRRAFEYEWTAIYLTPERWKEELAENPIDFLFVDSAWQMEHGDKWKYQVLGDSAPRQELKDLVAYCRENGTPTVFWNREDPPHYDDAIATAKLFDWVYTTDSNRLPSYRKDLGHENVGVLPFAAQLAIHNPMVLMDGYRPAKRRDVAFAGAYYGKKYPERQRQMDVLLSAAIQGEDRMEYGLDIFARDMGGGKLYRFPKRFRSRIRGSLTYPQTLSAYRGYRTFINVNSVVDSPTMSSMRLFELPACGTPIVSTPTPATHNFFTSDMVATPETVGDAEFAIRALVSNPELSDRMAYLAQQKIWREHTYTHRVDSILRDLGLGERVYRMPTVTAMVSTNRPHQLRHVIDTLAAQVDVEAQILVGTHGFSARDDVRAYAQDNGMNVMWQELDNTLTLGGCYNMLIERADGDYIAKIDDDDLYGPGYLFDSLIATRYSRADVVGKHAHYMYLTDKNVTVLRFPEWENQFSKFVSGPTIVGTSDVMKAIRFSEMTHGEDSDFLERVSKSGGKIYSAQRYGFAQIRHVKSGGHTWAIEADEVLATGKISHWGMPNETEFPGVFVPKTAAITQ